MIRIALLTLLSSCGAMPLPSYPPTSLLFAEKQLLLQSLPESKDWCEDPWADLSCCKVHRKEARGQECRRRGMEGENKNNSGATHDIPLSTPFWAFLPSFCFIMSKPEAFWYWLSVYNAMNSRHCFFPSYLGFYTITLIIRPETQLYYLLWCAA